MLCALLSVEVRTIYLRTNCWAKAGVLDRLFEKLEEEQVIRIRNESVSLDSTIRMARAYQKFCVRRRLDSDLRIPQHVTQRIELFNERMAAQLPHRSAQVTQHHLEPVGVDAHTVNTLDGPAPVTLFVSVTP